MINIITPNADTNIDISSGIENVSLEVSATQTGSYPYAFFGVRFGGGWYMYDSLNAIPWGTGNWDLDLDSFIWPGVSNNFVHYGQWQLAIFLSSTTTFSQEDVKISEWFYLNNGYRLIINPLNNMFLGGSQTISFTIEPN